MKPSGTPHFMILVSEIVSPILTPCFLFDNNVFIPNSVYLRTRKPHVGYVMVNLWATDETHFISILNLLALSSQTLGSCKLL